ncbi:hypothetical protein [Haloarchaeobius sp. DYHT-AS-18]|uniref:hypothetical protein n=1 Tax=Haloarchaeobius sp. DYHT-AS-18 TaxID=3446117 RepID=UPI003EBBA42F
MSFPLPEAGLSLFLTALLYIGYRSRFGSRALLSLGCAAAVAYTLFLRSLVGSPLLRAFTETLQAGFVLLGVALAVGSVLRE